MLRSTVVADNHEVLRALADPTRTSIVSALAVEQLCTCHLVDITGASQTNVSNHLRVLREADVVETQSAGRYTYYRLRPDKLDALAGHFAALASGARKAGAVRRPCE